MSNSARHPRRHPRAFWAWSAFGLCALATGCELELDLGHLNGSVPSGMGQLSCLTPSVDKLDFGRIAESRVAVRRLTMTNHCETDAWLDDVRIEGPADFTIFAAAMTGSENAREGGVSLGFAGPAWTGDVLGPGQTVPLAVAFEGNPNAAWTTGELVIDTASSAATGQERIALEANLFATCLDVQLREGSDLDFGCQPVGASRTAILDVMSCSGSPITVKRPVLAGDTSFRVSGLASDMELQPGQSTSFRVTYESLHEAGVSPVIDWDQGTVALVAENTATGETTLWSQPVRGFARYGTCTGLEIELKWSTPGDPNPADSGLEAGADLDLHVMHPLSLGWYRYPYDAFWINREPNWGDFSRSRDDPRMDSDSIDGTAPERITIALPERSLNYQLGVHCWNAHHMGPSEATIVVRYFGKEVFRQSQELADLDLWEVGTVSWPGGQVIPTAEDSSDAVLPAWQAPCDRTGCKAK